MTDFDDAPAMSPEDDGYLGDGFTSQADELESQKEADANLGSTEDPISVAYEALEKALEICDEHDVEAAFNDVDALAQISEENGDVAELASNAMRTLEMTINGVGKDIGGEVLSLLETALDAIRSIALSEPMDPNEDMDGDHASGLASAGFGTDEDYGSFGDDNDFYDVAEMALKMGKPLKEWSLAKGVKTAGSKAMTALKAFVEAYATINHGAGGIGDEMRHAYDLAVSALQHPDKEPELDRTAQMAVWGDEELTESLVGDGYNHCPCRDCFETVIGTELCAECAESGCVPCDCVDPEGGCPHGECQSPSAYGGYDHEMQHRAEHPEDYVNNPDLDE